MVSFLFASFILLPIKNFNLNRKRNSSQPPRFNRPTKGSRLEWVFCVLHVPLSAFSLLFNLRHAKPLVSRRIGIYFYFPLHRSIGEADGASSTSKSINLTMHSYICIYISQCVSLILSCHVSATQQVSTRVQRNRVQCRRRIFMEQHVLASGEKQTRKTCEKT